MSTLRDRDFMASDAEAPVLAILADGPGTDETNRRRYCSECDAWVHARRRPVNHGLHLLISLFLFPPWVISWAVITLMPSFACPQCEGHTTPGRGIWRWFHTFTVGVAVNGACLLLLLGIGQLNRAGDLRESQFGQLRLHLRAEDYQAGVAVLNEMLARDAEDIEALAIRGECHKHLGDHAAEAADQSKVIELATVKKQPQWLPDAYHQRGHAHQSLEQNDLAYEDFSRSVELEPDRLEFRKCRASLGLRTRKFDDAYADVCAAIKLDPKDGELYYWRAAILLHRNEPRAALGDLRQACELTDRKNADYLKLLEEVEESCAEQEKSTEEPSVL